MEQMCQPVNGLTAGDWKKNAMLYADQQDILDRFSARQLIQLTDDTNKPQTTIDSAAVTAALTDASVLADGYLAKKYALPLSSVPDVLKRKVVDIAWFYLHGVRVDKDSMVRLNYNDAEKWLLNVSMGKIQLEVAGIATEQSGDGSVQKSAPKREFTRDSLSGL